jgi:BirA family transcriptional regulator, biotin operon repressor / biotin---[acetyl-CoA-carboxylase] ligase
MSVIDFNSIIKLDCVDSTNNYATQRIVREGWNEGTIVLANEQSKGKGQKNNSWESEKGKNLLASIVLYPNFLPVQSQFEVSKVVALAVHDVISLYVDNVTIKWPNDIYIGDRKISGILIENAIIGNEISWVIAGIGININQIEFRSDAPNPVSLSMITGREYNLDEITKQFLHSISYWYKLLKSNTVGIIDKSFLEKLYRFNEEVQFRDDEEIFTGKIIGVNELGQLIIEKQNGMVKAYGFKEVAFLYSIFNDKG